MKISKCKIGLINLILCIGFLLSSCGFLFNEEKVDYGILTINDLPSVPALDRGDYVEYWSGAVYYDEDIKYYEQIVGWSSWTNKANMVAYWDYDKSPTSPFYLLDNRKALAGFKDSGTFIVEIYPPGLPVGDFEKYYAFMNVSFKNGKATISYNDMTFVNTLPSK